MPAGLTSSVLLDPALPLAEALDPERMREPLARAAGLLPGDLPIRGEVINHKPGRRCTIVYGVGGAKVVGKLYSRPVLAMRAHGWTIAVRVATRHPEDLSDVPEPRACIPELGLGLHAHVPGADLGRSLAPTAVVLAARWLGRLHATRPPDGVKTEPLPHELVRLDAWHEVVRAALRAPAAREVDRTHERLHALAAGSPERPPTLVHRDYYHENFLWDGARLWVLDFDQLAVGDPAVDVAHFQAHLAVLGYRRTGDAGAYSALAALFARAGPAVDERPLRFYRAHTFLKLAATEVERRQAGWQSHARTFARLAGDEAAGTTLRRRGRSVPHRHALASGVDSDDR